MPDIHMRFDKDLLVLSAPLDALLHQRGLSANDVPHLLLMEPETIADIMRMETATGAHCIVAPTGVLTPAQLAHACMTDDISQLAGVALDIANEQKPQHVLVELQPCGLPLDPSSKASLNEHRAQYATAARAFEGRPFDAFLLSGFSDVVDLKCALMGIAQVSDALIVASVSVRDGYLAPLRAAYDAASSTAHGVREFGEAAGNGGAHGACEGAHTDGVPFRGGTNGGMSGHGVNGGSDEACASTRTDGVPLGDALAVMVDLGAAVIGFETAEPSDVAATYAAQATTFGLPVLAQLNVMQRDRKQYEPTAKNPYYCADACERAAVDLYGAGVQFVRATGQATPAYTGALVATLTGLDVRR